MKKLFHAFGSLKLTVPLLLGCMALVFFATLDQVHWGINTVQKEYFESFVCAYPLNTDAWTPLPGVGAAFAKAGVRIPLPGGFLLGGLLLINLVCAHFRHFRASWAKSGIAVTHFGVLLLIVSGFTTAMFQRDGVAIIPTGGSTDFYSDFYVCELALIDTTDPKTDKVTVVPEALLLDSSKGVFAVPGADMEIRMHRFYENAPILPPIQAKNFPELTPVKVDNGIAAATPMVIVPQRKTFSPNTRNSPSAVLELVAGGKSLGTWLLNTDLAGTFPAQTFSVGERRWEIALRQKRNYFPFSLRLEKFTHDKYPGTEIPKNFASDITLNDPKEGAPRAVTISMNQPLRHAGLTFYQAGFDGSGATASTSLQTVRNPSYLLPYAAVFLVGAGMMIQFMLSLFRFLGRKKEMQNA